MKLPNRPVTVATLDEVVMKMLDLIFTLKTTSHPEGQQERLRREFTALISKVPAEEPVPDRVYTDGGNRTWDDEAKQRAKVADERSMEGRG